MTKPIIAVEDLHHTYMRDTPLARPSLRGIDLHVNKGEVCAIVGATGSGKSTLLQHMNGLLRPQRGRVWVDGQDTGQPSTDLRAIRRTVGLVFQRPGDQLFEQYVGDDIAYGPRLTGMGRAELRERVRWAMEQVGLGFDEYRDRLTALLSGGERRRVGLAGVLAMRPQVLLLDEPTAGLDPRAHAELLDRLFQFHADGLTIVLASHDMDDVALLARRVYVLHEGRIVLEGPTRKVFAQGPQLRSMGLGVPPMAALMEGLSARGLHVPRDVLTIAEAEQAVLAALRDWGVGQ